MLKTLALISIGASCAAILRWFLGLMLNAIFLPIPLGTLAANLLGGYSQRCGCRYLHMSVELGWE